MTVIPARLLSPYDLAHLGHNTAAAVRRDRNRYRCAIACPPAPPVPPVPPAPPDDNDDDADFDEQVDAATRSQAAAS